MYSSLEECVLDLEKHGHLIRITEEVDPYLELAAIHRRVYAANGPALLFENLKGCEFRAVSNLYGSLERSKFMFRDSFKQVQQMIELKGDPMQALKKPLNYASTAMVAAKAFPKKVSKGPVAYQETTIDKLPQLHSWPMDGGAFVTLPQVYTEDADKPGVMASNLGMYRIQLSGNDYIPNKEIGLHYQIHRGIGVHQSKANALGKPLKVSIFVGGPPSHTLSAVMPLPEGISELTFAGALGNRRFRYMVKEGYTLSADADFVICGEVYPQENKPEGPFGDHLGYYSLQHDFPLMKVHKVYHRKNAIWPFTVVGRPPQEDASFGALIHELTGAAIPQELPGVHAVHAVDAAGVHPLLFAVGSERYAPFLKERKPQEILTLSNAILGFGQLSLAKYLFIAAKEDFPEIDIHEPISYLSHILERMDLTRDVHFHTNTTMDTLDYSGDGLNSGSKVVFAAAGVKLRDLEARLPEGLNLPESVVAYHFVQPGVLALQLNAFESKETAQKEIAELGENLKKNAALLKGFPLIVLCDDSAFVAETINNFLWVTFTRSNPSHDIYGVGESVQNKHWGCTGSLMIDARIKPHHAPLLVTDPVIENRVDALGNEGGSLFGVI
ncbi:MAG: 4-hydroxy-3-polyprenylbenzoate decarboxylase [Sphingobacteriales bacterium]|jgi:4-hydroxy-3-polyprenylbenzoate decarboxylase